MRPCSRNPEIPGLARRRLLLRDRGSASRQLDVHVHAALSHADGHDGADGDTRDGHGNGNVSAIVRYRMSRDRIHLDGTRSATGRLVETFHLKLILLEYSPVQTSDWTQPIAKLSGTDSTFSLSRPPNPGIWPGQFPEQAGYSARERTQTYPWPLIDGEQRRRESTHIEALA